MRKFTLLCASAALIVPAMAAAQSTGTVVFEEEDDEGEEVVVTGTRTQEVAGIITPDTTKAQQVLTQEIISRQTAGQTINDIINLVPGVSFQNNDPYGSSGGTMTIRGFDSTRISQTFDGIPLNDTGNYAIYSNQQLDPELIERVNVNLGTTDVDSPTASAVGGTVNYRTRLPGEEFGPQLVASYGEHEFHRLFGRVDSGTLTSFGTRAFIAVSSARNQNPFNGFGEINKRQYNARIHQPIGGNNDFISLSGHYNRNRNNFGGSVPLRTDLTQSPTDLRPRVVGSASSNRFPLTREERFYQLNARCELASARANVADVPNSCGTEFDRRYNPSNTANIRLASRFTLADGLVLSVDPSVQFVKANGGGTVTAFESPCLLDANGRCGTRGTPMFGYIGGRPYVGVDLNGDGDLRDQVTVLAPSQTQTRRYVVISSLAYDVSDNHRVRAAYTFDRGRHRQTGEVGLLGFNGQPRNVFAIDDPLADVSGSNLQKRDRLSFATLHQISGEYRGTFANDRLLVQLGMRAPFFERELNQFCFTTSASGFVDCFGQDEARNARYAALRPNVAGPQSRTYNYNKVLPNVGATFKVSPRASLFASYSKGISVPGTDPLYASLFFSNETGAARPVPETTDNFDTGIRFRSGRIQAQLAGWYNMYQNRLATAYDPELDQVIFRNLGDVDKYGIDGSFAVEPVRNLSFYVWGSYLNSEIKDDLQTRTGFLETGGKREAGSPVYTLGARVQGTMGPVTLGAQAKRTGKRYVNDENLPTFLRGPGGTNGAQIFDDTVPAYTLVDLDARLRLAQVGLDRTYLQLNVSNLFDKRYVGGFGGASDRFGIPFVQIGAPRAVSASLIVGF